MRFISALVLTALLSFAGSLFFDWWIVAIAAFLVAVVIPQKSFVSFITGFAALFLLWGTLSFLIDYKNQQVLSVKIATLFYLGASNIAIILVTAFIGGMVAGMAALTGSFIRKPVR